MINWRNLRAFFLLLMLMGGFMVYGLFIFLRGVSFREVRVDVVSSDARRVLSAKSIDRPVVNPVQRIDVPERSIFAPSV